jgi:hypothetical protein
MFEYDHSFLSLIDLHGKGVRHTRELEEVIEGYSFADEYFLEGLGHTVIRFIGFTNTSKALKIICRLNVKGEKLITLDARVPFVQEIVDDFCKYC